MFKLQLEMKNYPKYLTFDNRHKTPSVLKQTFPLPVPNSDKRYFPKKNLIYANLNSNEAERKFEIAQFYIFLKDTIEVEHFLVIPAIANLKRINFYIPNKAKEDLYKIATDEGFHAEQSLAYLNSLKELFHIKLEGDKLPPKFIQKLELLKYNPSYEPIKELLPIIFGIVTETRISIELGQFAKNTELENSVREICLSHSIDEVIHSSQFQALGQWLWEQIDNELKPIVSASFLDAIIFRNMPDLDILIECFSFATNLSIEEARKFVLQSYNEDLVIAEMLDVCNPTLKYLLKNKMVSQQQIDDRMNTERSFLKNKLFNAYRN
jgi:hypothetical protein